MNRRFFLRSGALSTAGALLVHGPSKAGTKPENNKMIYRDLGKTGLKLPVVSMGVMRSDNPNLVKAALRSGIKHLDTAHVYQGGRNEVMLGNLLKDYNRDSFVISTKVKGEGMEPETGLFTTDTSPDEFLKKFNTSLERLQMDYVDILYLHSVWKREAVLFEPLMKVLETIKKEGRARFLGVSTHRNEHEVINAVAESDFYDVVLTAINYRQDHYPEVKEAVARAAEAGVGIVGMKTMAGGYIDRERNIPVNAKAALKFILNDPNVHTTIPGFTAFSELEEALSVMEDMKLTEEEMEELDIRKSQGGLYCDGCITCQEQCRKHLPVHDIMRSYMYAYGYNQKRDAQHLIRQLNIGDNPCDDCDECLIDCRKNFDIPGKIGDISRIKHIPSEFLT